MAETLFELGFVGVGVYTRLKEGCLKQREWHEKS